MIAPRVEISRVQLARRSAGLLIGLAALTCGLTLLYLASKAIMGIGGTCGTGGPYAGRPCPGGVGWIVPVSILIGLAGFGLYAISPLPVGPRLTMFAWPALFLSLGWAFVDSALATGPDWGFLILGAIFALMGVAPLVLLTSVDAWKAAFWGPAVPAPPSVRIRRDESARWISPIRLPGARTVRPETVPLEHNLVGELERLSALHSAGHLDDDEFAAAKARLLNGAH